MLNGRRPRRALQRGMTITELMIGLAIVAVLMVVALPEFSVWMGNTRIRTAADSVLSGVQLARAEAVRRNANVQFAFDTGSTWTITVPSTGETIQSRSSAEGDTAAISVTRTPGTATKLTFNSLGRTTANADASSPIEQVEVDNPVLGTLKSRELRITIGRGGNVRMCDPNVDTVGDPRKC